MVEPSDAKPTPTEAPSRQAEPDARVSILVVEDEGIVAQDLAESIARLGYRVTGIAIEGAQAVYMVDALKPDLVVMDVSLRGDIDGIQAAHMIHDQHHVPVIFLTGHRDQATLQRAVSAGPLGYIIKPFQEVELRCAIEVAIHKHRADVAMREREEALRRNAELLASLSLVDELTQLKNRRGFFELAHQSLKVARRENYTMALFFIDLNGLKRINDGRGHLTGDQALRDVATVLQMTFREADILARIGGDEFVALAHVNQGTQVVYQRLREQLDEFNAAQRRPYLLDVSIGMTVVSVATEEDIETLIARADAAMYEEKRAVSARS